MKKFVILILSLFIFPFFSTTFLGCGENNPETTIMTISLNPKVEFIVDKSNKVVTASALNNEGNFILVSDVFIGETYQTAIKKFVDVCYKYGYVLNGENANNKPIKLAISGDNYSMFKAVSDSLTPKYNIKVEKEDFDKNYLKNAVKNAYPTMLNVDKKSNEELTNLLKTSRVETQNLYTQELKEFYYQDRAKEILKAEITALKTYIQSQNNPTLNALIENSNPPLESMIAELDDLSTKFIEDYMGETSEYRTKLNTFINDKKGYLEARLNGESEDSISTLEQSLTALTQEMQGAYSDMSSHLTSGLDSLNFIRQSVYDGVKLVNNDIASVINSASKTAIEGYNEIFATYNLEEKNNYWKNLTPKINN